MSLDVKFSATDAGFTKTISKVKESVSDMDKGVKNAGESVNTSFAAMAKAGAGLAIGIGAVKAVFSAITGTIGEFKAAIDLGGELNDLSKRTGETAGNLLVLQQAFGNTGVDAGKVGPAINKLQKFMDDAGTAGSRQAGIMDQLGLTLQDLAGKTPTEQMQVFATRLSEIEDPTKRGALAMGVFGKAGGELLPLLSDFSGELAGARTQLGSMPDVMDTASQAFDGIGDAMAEIRKKTTQFAAGLLSELAPAIELVTTLMSQFDAAAAGVKLGQILTGASEAMGGFAAALDAVKIGEFTLAFEIAFTSIKLQAQDSINSIYANIQAVGAASIAFLKEMFGPGSSIFTIIDSSFEILGNKIAITLGEALKSMLGSIPGIGEGIANSLTSSINILEKEVENSSNKIKNVMGEIPNDFVRATEKASQAYDQTLQTATKLFDTTKDVTNLKQLEAELAAQITIANADQAEQQKLIRSELNASNTERTVATKSLIKIEEEIAQAKKDGNKAQELELMKQKAGIEAYVKALNEGLTIQQALTLANAAYNAQTGDNVVKEKVITEEKREQLRLTNAMQDRIDKAKEDERKKAIDPTGALERRLERAIERGNELQQKSIVEEMRTAERLYNVREALESSEKSLSDMMKEEGIPGIYKSTEDMLTALEKVAALAVAEKDLLDKKKLEDAKKLLEEKDPKDKPPETLESMVKMIRDLVQKIEPKLPQHALS